MKLEYLKSKVQMLTDSERRELETKEDLLYRKLRDLGFYRVFDTYYKDEYDCYQFYAIGFINSPEGYNWLLSFQDRDYYRPNNYRLESTLFNLYLVTKDNTKGNRKEQLVFTGTLHEILAYSKYADTLDSKVAVRTNMK